MVGEIVSSYRLDDDLIAEIEQYPTDGFSLALREWNSNHDDWVEVYRRRMIGYSVPGGIVEALTTNAYDFTHALEALDHAGISWTEKDFE